MNILAISILFFGNILFGSIYYITFCIFFSLIFLIFKSIQYLIIRDSFELGYYVKASLIAHLLTYICAFCGTYIAMLNDPVIKIPSFPLGNDFLIFIYVSIVVLILCINIYIYHKLSKQYIYISRIEKIFLGTVSTVCIIFGSVVIPFTLSFLASIVS